MLSLYQPFITFENQSSAAAVEPVRRATGMLAVGNPLFAAMRLALSDALSDALLRLESHLLVFEMGTLSGGLARLLRRTALMRAFCQDTFLLPDLITDWSVSVASGEWLP